VSAHGWIVDRAIRDRSDEASARIVVGSMQDWRPLPCEKPGNVCWQSGLTDGDMFAEDVAIRIVAPVLPSKGDRGFFKETLDARAPGRLGRVGRCGCRCDRMRAVGAIPQSYSYRVRGDIGPARRFKCNHPPRQLIQHQNSALLQVRKVVEGLALHE
jgi:hypothetical protein